MTRVLLFLAWQALVAATALWVIYIVVAQTLVALAELN